ncbi:MAG: LuxR C-terminal-related transcriptional regulator [Planctomycetota bacterium]
MDDASHDSGNPNDVAEASWNALTADPAVGVAVIDVTGEIHYANEQIASMFLGRTGDEIVGHTLFELYPPEWATERVRVFMDILQTGKPAIMRHIRRGVQLQSAIHAIDTPDDLPPRFLTITHRGQTDADEERFEVIESEFANLGPLDKLTTRELEVLSLIKQGLKLNDIAKLLHRSVKTIDNHRSSIMKKLGVSSRVEMAKIAEMAGLEMRDAGLRRV